MSVGAVPGKTIVDDTRFLKRRNQGIVGAMDVTNRNYSLDAREMPFIRLRQ
jgi:hypothetical protein